MKKGMTILLVCCALRVQAYALYGNQHLPQTLTYSCPNDIGGKVAAAFTAWNFATDNYFKITRVAEGADVTITVVDLPKPYNGLALPLGRSAFIQIDATRGVAYDYVIPHELGHAFGLGHSTDTEAIMCATVAGYGVAQDDINAIRENYSLSPKTFDFKSKVTRHTFTGLGLTRRAAWITPEGFTVVRRRFTVRLPPGVYTVILIDMGLAIRKEVVIK